MQIQIEIDDNILKVIKNLASDLKLSVDECINQGLSEYIDFHCYRAIRILNKNKK